MKAIYIGKLFRDGERKFIPGQEYDLSAKELEKYPGKFEVSQPKPKTEVKEHGNS